MRKESRGCGVALAIEVASKGWERASGFGWVAKGELEIKQAEVDCSVGRN